MATTLSVSNLVRVAVNLSPAAAQSQNLSTLLVLDDTTVINTTERFRVYSSIDAVAADFGTSGNHYNAALAYFSQSPAPAQIMLGRWVKAASKGALVCAPLTTANALLSSWTGITTGSFSYQKDGGAATNATGLNFSSALNLNGVAAIIQTAMTGVTVTYNAGYNRFEFTSNTTGATSAISFLSPTGSGVDISGKLGATSTSSGAYVVAGQVAETAADAVALFDANFGMQWYALNLPSGADADHLAVAAYIEAASNKHLYGVNTQAAGTLVSTDTANIAYQLAQLKYKKTLVQYSSSSTFAACSLLGRAITTNFNGNNTVITLMFKQEPGIAAESINQTQANALAANKCNAFVNYNNGTSIIQNGVVCSGDFIDVITGTDWLAVDIQTNVYNLLYTSSTKIPQTDSGVHLIVTTIESRCSQAVTNGLLAPGVWSSGGFGLLNQGDFLQKGFYVYANPLSSQSTSDRAARKAPPIQIAAKLAGAVHSVDIQINVNR
jgi:hypothetical protein